MSTDRKPTMGPGTSGLQFEEPLLFEISTEGREGSSLPAAEIPDVDPGSVLPADCLRDDIPGFPELSEVDVVRHFTRLSQWNYGVDLGLYPLGSCTMKYNPKVNEDLARLPGFANLHPLTPIHLAQGALAVLHELERILCEITGMDRVTLQPAAGAQGELAGMMMIRAYHEAQGKARRKVLVPDTAHGTNPASCALSGFQVVQVRSGARGVIDPSALEPLLDEDVATLMVTNPNTLGLFEENIRLVSEMLHAKGALLYMDGANMNALMGIAKPAHLGADVIQLNLHKTFSTPHGGGGPGAGPVGVRAPLAPFLPAPVVEKRDDRYILDADRPLSIGRIRSFHGNFGVVVRALAYVLSLGGDGLAQASRMAILNANYVLARLRRTYHVPFDRNCMHECVLTDKHLRPAGISTLDVAKRLIDHGFHPPTIYFPLVVQGALMIEPTETESLRTLDEFVDTMEAIAREATEEPEVLHAAPSRPRVARMDEVAAARKPRLRWKP